MSEFMPLSRPIYLKITDKKDSKTTYDARTVWDMDLFMASIEEQYRKEGEKDKMPDRYKVERVSEAIYRAAMLNGGRR